MANNPYANKVIYGNQTIMDLSEDTVAASDVLQGKTFHDATGALLTGTYTPSASGYTIHIFTEDSNLFGNTITISKDDVVLGTTTFDNTGNATFDVQQKGTYVASTTYQGTVYQKAVNVTDEFLVELSEVLDGKTVLPTDDIQIWLKCAGINDKAYTTLAEVLADTDTLSALIASNNAVDYMVRSTTWAVAITVPVMTSNTTPSGLCFASSVYDSSYPEWRAFDGNDTTDWNASTSDSVNNCYLGYEFTSPVCITKLRLRTSTWGSGTRIAAFKVQGYNTEWEDIYSVSGRSDGDTSYTFANTTSYLKYRILVTGVGGNPFPVGAVNVLTLQFYSASITDNSTAMSYIGANNYASNTLIADLTWLTAIVNSDYRDFVLNVKTPKMTSDTTPEGECFANASQSTNLAPWKAFDDIDTTAWRDTHNYSVNRERYLGYKFTSAVRIVAYEFVGYVDSNILSYPVDYKIQGSNDNTTWVDLKSSSATGNKVEGFTNEFQYLYYRLYSTNWHLAGSGDVASLVKLQFYGREDVVEPEPSTEMVLYENGTQYVELSNKMSGITNSAVFQSSYIQCPYYSTNACGFSSVNGFDIEGYKSLKVRFKLANNDSYVKVVAADLETNFLNKGITSVKLGFGYRGNVATLYLKDAQYSVTTSDYWASTVSGGSNYIAVDKIWLE